MDQDPVDRKRQQWDAYYAASNSADRISEPATVLAEYSYLLPAQGKALDLACGLAGNGFFMAQRGLAVSAWDSSASAIQRVAELAKKLHVAMELECRNVEIDPPAKNSFDVILVSRFLSRPICPSLCAALRPNGLLFYQTFIVDKEQYIGPSNPDYLLQKNELLRLFEDLTVRVYVEQGMVGDRGQGIRNEALLVASKES